MTGAAATGRVSSGVSSRTTTSRSSSAARETGDVVLGQLVLVGESLNVLFLDETALGGLLEQALDRREVMQMNRVAQCCSFRS